VSRLRAGIIGLGVGEQHIAGYREHPDADVVAICDFDEQRLAEVAGRNPELRAEPAADALLDDPEIDVVSICSYDQFHFEQAERALASGKHVFVEKPLCQHEGQARAIAGLLRANPALRLSSNLPLRRSPRFVELRERLAAGELGRLYYAEGDYDYGRLWKITEGWRGDVADYSVVLGGAVHLVDLLLWLTGEQVTEVTGTAGNQIASAGSKFSDDDLVVALLRFESGAVAKIGANFGCVHPHFHGLRLYGTDGTFVNGLPDATLWRRGDGDYVSEPVPTAYPGVAKGVLLHSFVDAILNGARPAVTEHEVFEALAVCFAIERARRNGAPTPVGHFEIGRG
jgi:predicted dehydrogenase